MPLSANLRAEIASAQTDPRYFLWDGIAQYEDEQLILEVGNDLSRLDYIFNDGHVSSLLSKRALNVIRREWEIEPGGKRPIDKDAAELAKKAIDGVNIDSISESVLIQSIVKGSGYGELIWDIVEGRNIFTDIIPRPTERFAYKLPEQQIPRDLLYLGYELRVLTKDDPLHGMPAPYRKFLVHSRGSKIGSPLGRGIGSTLHWLVDFKAEVVKFWLIFLDKFSSPTPVGQYDRGNIADRDALTEALDGISQEGRIVIPKNVVIDLLETARRDDGSFESFVEWANREASKLILGETLSTQEGVSGGSRAATETHAVQSSVYLAKYDSDLLSESINRILRWLTEVNYPGAMPPKFWRKFPELDALPPGKEEADRDNVLCSATGKKLDIKFAEEKYGVVFSEENVEPTAPANSLSLNPFNPDDANPDNPNPNNPEPDELASDDDPGDNLPSDRNVSSDGGRSDNNAGDKTQKKNRSNISFASQEVSSVVGWTESGLIFAEAV